MSVHQAAAASAGEDAEQVLDARARALAAPIRLVEARAELHLVLVVGEHRLGVPAHRVRHVAPPRPVTLVPTTAAAILGVAQVLGGIVAVADLALLVGATPAVPQAQRPLVLVDDGADQLALLVDEVEELTALEVAGPEAAGGTLAGPSVGGVRRLDLDALLADPGLASLQGPSPEHARSPELAQGAS